MTRAGSRGLLMWLVSVSVAMLQAQATSVPMNEVADAAETYVKLVLAVGEHDPAYVDAYYGSDAWKQYAAAARLPLADIAARAEALRLRLGPPPAAGASGDPLGASRHAALRRQIVALEARVSMLTGKTLSFDEESEALYDAVAPRHPESFFADTLAELDARLGGGGDLAARYETFRRGFVIPAERLAAVFDLAIAECRRRTLARVELPADERFRVEYVTDKPWSGYNWYQGGFHSLIQVNTDLPIYIDRALDLACHEGYPGHHVYNVRLEERLVRGRGWVEFAVYPLFSPQSLIAEGTANFGIEVAFPGEARLAFERDVLFPAAGLDPATAADFRAVQAIVSRLKYAGNEAARRYLDGEIDRDEATASLRRLALMSPAAAAQRTRFFDQYRSYVINYNLGEDLVRAFVEARGGTEANGERRWAEFVALLGAPVLPSALRLP